MSQHDPVQPVIREAVSTDDAVMDAIARVDAVDPDIEHLVGARQVGVGAGVQHERAEAADPGDDRLIVLRVQPHVAR